MQSTIMLRSSGTSAAAAATRARAVPLRARTVVRATPAATLYEKLGGKEAITAAVDVFYGKVLADPRVNEYFAGTDMKKQRAHQAAFMTLAFGGPNAYAGRDMAAAHRHLVPHLTDAHFDAIVEHFVATLQELGVGQDDIDAAVAVVASTKPQVLAD